MESDTDSDVDILLAYYLHNKGKRRCPKQRRYWIHSTIAERKNCGEYNRLIAELRADDERFKMYFRLAVAEFDELLEMTRPLIARMNTTFRDALPIYQQNRNIRDCKLLDHVCDHVIRESGLN